MVISKEKQLRKIQEEFQTQFPFLKLEFYSGFNKRGEGADKQGLLDNNLTVGEICKLSNDVCIAIHAMMKVSELEKAFKDIFGLSVQVFRKSNNLWLPTTITDGWSLLKQNQNAEEMHVDTPIKFESQGYHEQD